MTRKEAIKLLRKLRETIDRNNAYGEAEEMGIQALEQEPVLDKIRAELMLIEGMEEALEIIDKYREGANE